MASTTHKDYHSEEYDPVGFIQTYTDPANEKFRQYIMEHSIALINKSFSSGLVKGNTLIDLSVAPLFGHLLVIANTFKEITIVDSSETNRQETEKWLKQDSGAVDWSAWAKIVSSLTGKSEPWQKQEENVRRVVKRILPCDFTKDNPLDPVVLGPVDCVFTALYLESISKDRDTYISNLRKAASLVKVGGYMVMFVPINMSYYVINNHKFFILSIDEAFIQKALVDLGFTLLNTDQCIDTLDTHLFDIEHMLYIVACKKK
ncbi:indolethylamine N-methyltransferase-like [Pseudophryne corroboree]|uniref:indolethylamine N-methyltransferase-like n=1 Tax=Pseudophryne corroboree TaxID=495146 RepID=UPI003081FC64